MPNILSVKRLIICDLCIVNTKFKCFCDSVFHPYFIIMGSVLPAKKNLDALIDSDYKSLRKYSDEVYGELTVLEDRKTYLQYALLQQTIDDPDRF